MSIHIFFFFNDTATTEIYTLSLHDALPISQLQQAIKLLQLSRMELVDLVQQELQENPVLEEGNERDRKSTRLNSSHSQISYAVFCLKKKKKQRPTSANASNNTTQPDSTTSS